MLCYIILRLFGFCCVDALWFIGWFVVVLCCSERFVIVILRISALFVVLIYGFCGYGMLWLLISGYCVDCVWLFNGVDDYLFFICDLLVYDFVTGLICVCFAVWLLPVLIGLVGSVFVVLGAGWVFSLLVVCLDLWNLLICYCLFILFDCFWFCVYFDFVVMICSGLMVVYIRCFIVVCLYWVDWSFTMVLLMGLFSVVFFVDCLN